MPVRSRTLISTAFFDSAARTAMSQVGVVVSVASIACVSVLVRLSVLLSVSYYRGTAVTARSVPCWIRPSVVLLTLRIVLNLTILSIPVGLEVLGDGAQAQEPQKEDRVPVRTGRGSAGFWRGGGRCDGHLFQTDQRSRGL